MVSVVFWPPCLGARQANLDVPPARPVDRHSDFGFGIIQIYDDFL